MIHSIEGKILQKHATFTVINVSGIGFGLHIPLSTYEKLGNPGTIAQLITYLHVREDTLQFFGFHTTEERDLFLSLISISGIGPKLAIGILSGVSVKDFCAMIENGDTARIKRIPGIGQKTADRLIVELKNRVGKIFAMQPSPDTSLTGNFEEAMLALQSLGYKQNDAQKMLNTISKDLPPNTAVEELIKLTLKKLM